MCKFGFGWNSEGRWREGKVRFFLIFTGEVGVGSVFKIFIKAKLSVLVLVLGIGLDLRFMFYLIVEIDLWGYYIFIGERV